MPSHSYLRRQLQRLEQSLREANLWQASPPSLEALTSQQPFAVDTLHLEQWLQFIFIPRMSALLDAKAALPQSLAITPYAQEAFKNYPATVNTVLCLLKELDEYFQ
ncbi:YqcC family protein [Celerinatantimonas yamalensis]|uniref:YqcC family protein n=1 Tax=Celerinatantimonas yamalensis TaxID=559956 RepID=A0ABW9G9B4_9GAMM